MDPSTDIDDISLDLSDIPTKQAEPVGPTRKLLTYLGNDDYILYIDWSSIESFLQCPRKAFWHLLHSRGGYEAPALTYGRAVHKGLEAWYAGQGRAEALLTAETTLMENPPPPGEWRDVNRLLDTLKRYFAYYPTERFDVVPGFVERPFELPLGTVEVNAHCQFPRDLVVKDSPLVPEGFYIRKIYVVWTGVVDLCVTQNGSLWNLDHKTTSMGGAGYFASYILSQQFIGYTWATSEILQQEVKGTILNVLIGRKPTAKGKGVPIQFERQYFDYSDFKKQNWREDIIHHCESLIHALVSGTWAQNTFNCVNKFGTCPFLRVCSLDGEEEQSLMAYSDIYARNVWNPLELA